MSRGENLMYSPTSCRPVFGIVISVRISSALITVWPGLRKNSSRKTIVSPPALTIFAVAFKAIRLGATSADGAALVLLQPTDVRHLTWIDPTSAALWQRLGYLLFTSESI